jgi:uncharacterized protein
VVPPLDDVPGEARVIDATAIQTFSGRAFRPLSPEAADVDPQDVAHALSNICRFGGHSRVFLSVAQHSCVVADAVAEGGGDLVERRWALLHDASEAYLGDLPHPLKHRTPLGAAYREAEERLMLAICERFELPPEPPALVKRVDRAVLAAERRALMAAGWEWPELEGIAALELELEPWPPERAAHEFLARLASLEAER